MDDEVQRRQKLVSDGIADFKEARLHLPNSGVTLDRVNRLARKQSGFQADLQAELEKQAKEVADLEESTAQLIDPTGKIKADDLRAQANRLDQARFDKFLFHILGRDDSLDQVRELSHEHKNALLNHEAELAQSRYKNDVDKLQQQLTESKKKQHDSEQKLADSEQKLADSEKKIGDQAIELETVQVDRSEVFAELARVRDELSTAQEGAAQARSAQDDVETKLVGAETEIRLVSARAAEADKGRSAMEVELIAVKRELAITRNQLQKSTTANAEASEQLDAARDTLETCTSVIFDLEEQREALTGQLAEENHKCSTREEELRQSQAEHQQTRTDLKQSQADLEKSKAETKQVEAELIQIKAELHKSQAETKQSESELQQSQDKLKQASTDLQKMQQDVEAQQKGLAAFFAGHAGFDASDAAVTAMWRPLATALTSADWIAGIPLEEGRTTWTLLPFWYGDNLAPLPQPPLTLLELLLRVHAATLSGDFGRGSSDRLRHLTNMLARVSSLPVGLLAKMADQALDTLTPHDGTFDQSLEKQFFNMALRQLLQLCRNRWPGPEIERLLGRTKPLVQERSFLCMKQLEAQIGDGNDAALLQNLANSRDADGEVPDRDGLFFLSGRTIGLLRAAEDHIWAFDLEAHTVRLIHATRGAMVRDVHYVFRSSEREGGSPDLIIPTEQDGEYFWCMQEWGRALKSRGGGCDMSQFSDMSG